MDAQEPCTKMATSLLPLEDGRWCTASTLPGRSSTLSVGSASCASFSASIGLTACVPAPQSSPFLLIRVRCTKFG